MNVSQKIKIKEHQEPRQNFNGSYKNSIAIYFKLTMVTIFEGLNKPRTCDNGGNQLNVSQSISNKSILSSSQVNLSRQYWHASVHDTIWHLLYRFYSSTYSTTHLRDFSFSQGKMCEPKKSDVPQKFWVPKCARLALAMRFVQP